MQIPSRPALLEPGLVGSGLVEHIVRLAGIALLVLALAACSQREDAAQATVTEAVAGTISYSGSAVLAETAIVEAELVDVSAVDGPSEVISLQRLRNPGPFPVHFRLEYPPGRIDPTHRYTVQVRILQGEQVVFATDTPYPVITQGNPRVVDIGVIAIGSAGETVPVAASEPAVEGTVATEGMTATYAAQFEDGKLVSIQEDRDAGLGGKASAEYQFKEGRLLRYLELSRGRGSSGSTAMSNIELNLVFDDTGELLAATKTIDNTGVKPDLAEIDGARNRAELLRNHALAAKASRDHAH